MANIYPLLRSLVKIARNRGSFINHQRKHGNGYLKLYGLILVAVFALGFVTFAQPRAAEVKREGLAETAESPNLQAETTTPPVVVTSYDEAQNHSDHENIWLVARYAGPKRLVGFDGQEFGYNGQDLSALGFGQLFLAQVATGSTAEQAIDITSSITRLNLPDSDQVRADLTADVDFAPGADLACLASHAIEMGVDLSLKGDSPVSTTANYRLLVGSAPVSSAKYDLLTGQLVDRQTLQTDQAPLTCAEPAPQPTQPEVDDQAADDFVNFGQDGEFWGLDGDL